LKAEPISFRMPLLGLEFRKLETNGELERKV